MTLEGVIELSGTVDVTVEAIYVNCRNGESHKALIVPQGADTTLSATIEGLTQLRCPFGDFRIQNQLSGNRSGAGLVAIAGSSNVENCFAKIGYGASGATDTFNLNQ